MPEVAISPSGGVSIAAGTFFTFNCSVTFKIPPLPTGVFINGQFDDEFRAVPDGPPVILHPLYIQSHTLQNVNTDDNGTTLLCAADVNGQIVSSSLAMLLVFGGSSSLYVNHDCSVMVFVSLQFYDVQFLSSDSHQRHTLCSKILLL